MRPKSKLGDHGFGNIRHLAPARVGDKLVVPTDDKRGRYRNHSNISKVCNKCDNENIVYRDQVSGVWKMDCGCGKHEAFPDFHHRKPEERGKPREQTQRTRAVISIPSSVKYQEGIKASFTNYGKV